MKRTPEITSITLLNNLKNPSDNKVWEEFYNIYYELIVSMAQKSGCSESLLDDVVQETFITLVKKLPQFEYNNKKGKFKSFLKTIVFRRVKDSYRKRKGLILENDMQPDMKSEDINFIENMGAEAEDNSQLDRIWLRSIIKQALNSARQKVTEITYQSFKLSAIDELPVSEICEKLEIARPGTVYQQKSRFLKIVISEMERLLTIFGDSDSTRKEQLLDSASLLPSITEIIKSSQPADMTIIDKLKSMNYIRVKTIAASLKNAPVQTNAGEQMPYFLELKGNERKWIQINKSPWSVGRLEPVNLVINNRNISSLHAVVYEESGDWFIKDEMSTNGTFINGEKLTSKKMLKNGDIVHFAEKGYIFISK